MTSTTTDLSSVRVLLDQLQDESITSILSTHNYETEALEYLNSICSGEELIKPDSITLELGELENTENLFKSSIQKKTVANVDLIISLHETMNKDLKRFEEGFNVEFEELYQDIKEDGWRPTNFLINGDTQTTTTQQQQQQLVLLQNLNASDSSIILQNIDNIMDILELPLLTLACVKQGHYSESLEISSHSKRLSIRYSDIEIITKIENDIKLEIQEMLIGLIRLLRTDLKQSSILKIMTYLKRINHFNSNNDKELKLIYLQLRYHYVVNELQVLDPIKNSSVEKFLKRNIEVIREHCFSTIIAFENIFNSKDESVLRDFVVSVINQLVKILRENLPLVEEHSVKENLLLQLCYCSSSLNRIGFEFSAILLSELSDIISVHEWLVVVLRKKKLSF